MKIAMLMLDTIFVGGVVPYIKDLYHGLIEAGHSPSLVFGLERSKKLGLRADVEDLDCGGMSLVHTKSGGGSVYFSPDATYLYEEEKDRDRLVECLSGFDGVILLQLPMYNHGKKSDRWMKVLRHGKPMICILHDTNWKRSQPWLVRVRSKFKAFIAVHPAAYETILDLPAKIACVINPFDISEPPIAKAKNWDAVCLTAFFRGWKHNDDAIRAVPYLSPVTLLCTGDGIELTYMRATILSRKEYETKGRGSYTHYLSQIARYTWRESDPDVKSRWLGKSIWEMAQESGNFRHYGIARETLLSAIKQYCGGSLDMSYRPNCGEYFNRVTIEAMVNRSIPFARPLGISGRQDGRGIIFGPENVVMIPEDASPKRIAEIIKSSLADESLRYDLVARNLERIKIFDRKRVARDMVNILKDETDVGLFGIQEGRPGKDMVKLLERFGSLKRFPR